MVDASFFPSSAALNPALTVAAQALRVGAHLKVAAQRVLSTTRLAARLWRTKPTTTSSPAAAPAGCVLAHRLSADPDVRVLLLEAGGSDRHPLFHMPAGFAKMTKGIGSWGWHTVPQRQLKGRVLRYTQAKVIGGGSSINAQLYTRGVPADYDEWVSEEGAVGWSYREVLPYFKRAENNQRFANEFHAYGGPLGVSNPISPLPICEAFFQAGQELGIPFNPDFNGARQEGLGYYQLTQLNARRSSTAVGI